jgi:hypothetical protein
MGTGGMERKPMGLQNRKKFAELCRRYGLECREDRYRRDAVVFWEGEQFPHTRGIVTFYELRSPDWEKLESMVVKISMSTGAWMV